MNVKGWFSLGLTGLISLQSMVLWRIFSSTQFESINSLALSLLYGSTLTSICDCWKNRNFKRHLLLGRKAVTNLDSVLKGRDITLLTEVSIVKADDFIWYSIDDAEVIRKELVYPLSTESFSLPAFLSSLAAFLPFELPSLHLRPPTYAFDHLLKFQKLAPAHVPPSLSSVFLLLHHFQKHKHAEVPRISLAPLNSCPLQKSFYILYLHFLSFIVLNQFSQVSPC